MNEIAASDGTNDMPCLSGNAGSIVDNAATNAAQVSASRKNPNYPQSRPRAGALPEIFLRALAADNGRFIKQIMDLISAPCVSNPSFSLANRRRDCLADFKPSPQRSAPLLRLRSSSSRFKARSSAAALFQRMRLWHDVPPR